VLFAVKAGATATPAEFVFTVAVFDPPANVPLAPEPGAVNVTLAPLTGLVPSSTVACMSVLNGAPTTALWLAPAVAVMVSTGVAVFVSEKVAEFDAPETVAVIAYGPPTVLLAVNTGAMATPVGLVFTVAVVPPPANVPLAPEPGAVNNTGAPLTALPPS
jgi:hypothetical protein